MDGNPYLALVKHWRAKIVKAHEAKAEFDRDAKVCMSFFNGPYDFLYQSKTYDKGGAFALRDGSDFPTPTFQININKVAEGVQLFGPALYHKNPDRKVNPRAHRPPPLEMFGDPMDPRTEVFYQSVLQQVGQGQGTDAYRALLFEDYTNFTPQALGLKQHARQWVDETIIKGASCLWTETYRPPGARWQMVGSFYDTVDNVFWDADAKCTDDAQFVARRCVAPVWKVEEEYGLPRGTLKGTAESPNQQAEMTVSEEENYLRAKGETNDLLVYWKIWSKMGIGTLLSGVARNEQHNDLERFGRYCHLVICDTCPYPLNLPPETWTDDRATLKRIAWPTPFWADDGWPVKMLGFHWVPGEIYPVSHFKPAMGELLFLNWAYSFIASKMASGIKDLIAVQKAASEDIERALRSGADYEIIKLESALGPINQVVQFLQRPPFQKDFWEVVMQINEQFEKRTGLNELMYGMSATQSRSAVDAQVKGENIKIRPDDMANILEDAMSDVGKMEAIASKWHLEPQRDIAPVLGHAAAHFWEKLITREPLENIVHGLSFQVEAGSIRKPNRDKEAADATAAMNQLFAPFMQYSGATGNVDPSNALISFWATAQQMDPTPFLLPPIPIPEPVPAGPPAEKPKEKAA